MNDATADIVPIEEQGPRPIREIETMDDYLKQYGRILGMKATESLEPLHTPDKDPLDEDFFGRSLCEPFECQKHVVAAATRMLDAQGSGFLVGEMGTGKTRMGMWTIHQHARGKPYRAIVLCPDHLIAVWDEELKETIPGVIIRRFKSWKDFVPLLDGGVEAVKQIEVPTADGTSATVTQRRKLWSRPLGPEWYIVGRNQAKWLPDAISLGDQRRGFGGALTTGHSKRHLVTARVAKTDENGRPVYDKAGRQVQEAVISQVVVCPECGGVPTDNKGIPLAVSDLAGKKKALRRCNRVVAIEVPEPGTRKQGRDRTVIKNLAANSGRDGKVMERDGKKFVLRDCNAPLWNYTSKPYRWAPARLVQKKMRKMFKYLIVDEVHEQKSDESAQSMAAGKLMAATRHTLALTGTLIGGYANHLYPLMIRMTPDSLREEGFEWGKDMAFSEVYGRIDRIVTTKMDDGGTSVGKNVTSMRKARTGRATERKAVRPGVMPSLFGRHMLGTSLFITLEELADELPDLFEYVGGPIPNPPAREQFDDPKLSPEEQHGRFEYALDGYERMRRGYVEVDCSMDAEVAMEYRRVEKALTDANRELLKRGCMKLLGTMLYTLMDYPDKPYGWEPEHEKQHTVGYYEKPKDFTPENWRGVVSPLNLDPEVVRPKERRLIDICKAEKAAGRQAWVYCQMTGKRNVMPRLKILLEREGLRVAVLRADTVNPKERKEWIDKNGPDFDVIISHPKLVSTGLTLFSKQSGGHNFSTLIFYETGYNLFDMRQASRRAWRIGQPHDCRVYYLYYRDTMQHRAMQLMSRKMAAAAALEGEFSTEGLVAMAGEDNAQMALARSLSERMDDSDMQRSWSKIKSGPPKKPRRTEALAALTPEPPKLDTLDNLPMPLQLAATTILDNQEPAPDAPDLATFGSARKGQPQPEPEPSSEEDEPDTIPMPTREQLARMFQNLLDNGMSLNVFMG